jgi:NitT/TauT family transport system substrate-binding protein
MHGQGNLGRTRRRRRSLIAIVACAALTVVGTGVASAATSHKAAPKKAAGLTTMHFATVSPQIQPAIMNHWIGKYLGYFAQEGINADIQTSPGASQTLQELLSGQLDVAIGTLETIYAAAAQGTPLPMKMFYQYQMVSAYQMAVDPSSSVKTVPDLTKLPRPIKIGVISTAETGYFYAKALLEQDYGIPDKDIQWVTLGSGPAALEAVKNHQVDAFSTFTSLYAIWHTQGYDVTRLPQPDGRIHNIGNAFLIAKTKDLADPKKAKLLAGYARAVAKATIFATANTNVACRINFAMYPETLSPSITYAQNIANCTYIWKDREKQYDPKTAGLKEWGGPIRGDQIARYASILGFNNVNTTPFWTNSLITSLNTGLNVKAIQTQALNYCKVPAHKALCTKSS